MNTKYKNNNIHIQMDKIDSAIFSEKWHDDKLSYFADFISENDLYIYDVNYYGYINMFCANNGKIYIIDNSEFNDFFTGKKIILKPVAISDYDIELLKQNDYID